MTSFGSGKTRGLGKVQCENERGRGTEWEAFARINETAAQDAVSSAFPYPGDTHEAAHAHAGFKPKIRMRRSKETLLTCSISL